MVLKTETVSFPGAQAPVPPPPSVRGVCLLPSEDTAAPFYLVFVFVFVFCFLPSALEALFKSDCSFFIASSRAAATSGVMLVLKPLSLKAYA